MSWLSRIKEALSVGDTINVHVSREEFEAYRKEQDELQRVHLKAEEDNDCELMAEIKERTTEAIRQRALREGPSFMRRFWWRISDAFSCLPAVLIVLEKWLYAVFWGGSLLILAYNLVTLFNFARATGLAMHTILILLPLLAFNSLVAGAMTAHYYGDRFSRQYLTDRFDNIAGVLVQLFFIWIFYIFTSFMALAPSGSYVGIVKNSRGVLTVEDYRDINWISNPIEHSKQVVQYYSRPSWPSDSVNAQITTKVAGKDVYVYSSIRYAWPDSTKFIDLYKAKGSVESEEKFMQDKFLKVFAESLPINDRELLIRLKSIEEAKKLVGGVNLAEQHLDEVEEKCIQSIMEASLNKRLGELGDGIIEPQKDSLTLVVSLVKQNEQERVVQ